jgi:hypothetical protein
MSLGASGIGLRLWWSKKRRGRVEKRCNKILKFLTLFPSTKNTPAVVC